MISQDAVFVIMLVFSIGLEPFSVNIHLWRHAAWVFCTLMNRFTQVMIGLICDRHSSNTYAASERVSMPRPGHTSTVSKSSSCRSKRRLVILLLPLLIELSAAQCIFGITYSLNGACVACPISTSTNTMYDVGVTSCNYIGYAETTIGGTSTFAHSLNGVEMVQIWLFGAKAGENNKEQMFGGNGGYLSATLQVSQYASLSVVMGPAPDVRTNATDLFTRLVVAGAGGWNSAISSVAGGAGGGEVGGSGADYSSPESKGGTGGAQTYPGASPGSANPGAPGTFGYGGQGYDHENVNYAGGRGGDGWYGGGGGGYLSGGGGGSSYAVSSAAIYANVQGAHASLLSELYITVMGCSAGYLLPYEGACYVDCPTVAYQTSTACVSCNLGYATPVAGTLGSDATACTVCAAGYSGRSGDGGVVGTDGCSICP